MFGKNFYKKSKLVLSKPSKEAVPEIVYAYSYHEQFGNEAFIQHVRQYFGEHKGGLHQEIFNLEGKLINRRQFDFEYTPQKLEHLWRSLNPFLRKLSTIQPLYNKVKSSAKSSLTESFAFVLPCKQFVGTLPVSLFDRFSNKNAQLFVKNSNAEASMMSIAAHEQFLNMRCALDKEFYRLVPRKEVQVKTDYQLNNDESLLVLVNDFIVDTVKNYAFPGLKKKQNYLLSDAYKIKVVKAQKQIKREPIKREILFEEEAKFDFSKIAISPSGLRIG